MKLSSISTTFRSRARITNIERLTIAFRHKWGPPDKVPDTLSYHNALLTIVGREIIEFDYMKDLYEDRDFKDEWWKCNTEPIENHQPSGGFFYSWTIVYASLRIPLRTHYRELHVRRLGGHIGIDKSIVLAEAMYAWPYLNIVSLSNVVIYARLQRGKQTQNTRLSTSLPIVDAL